MFRVCANNKLMHRSEQSLNSITSSARARSDCGASLCYPIVARGSNCRAATWRIRSAVASGAVSGNM